MSAPVQHELSKLPDPFEPMRFAQQWIVYRLHSPDANRKYQKQPIDHRTGRLPNKGHGGTEIQTDFETASLAAAKLGAGYGVGFYFTTEDPFFFLDIDNCAVVDGKNAVTGWSPLAQELCGMFPGAAVEISSSGRGLHIIGSGKSPPHKSRNTELHIEFYTQDRWVALTGVHATGSAAVDHTAAVVELVAKYFSPSDKPNNESEWTDEPRPEWHGPDNDDALIEIAFRSRKKLWSRASFKDLYEMNEDKLGRVFPPDSSGQAFNASSADLSLANALAFWTGNHCARMERIMRESELTRGKWDRPSYIRRTILKACAATNSWYNDGKGTVAADSNPACNSLNPGIGLEDFHAYLAQHLYVFVPTRDLWPASGVDASVPWINGMKPSVWLDKARPVHQMIWAPGEPMIVADRLVSGGGWIDRAGANTFNLYMPPSVALGDAKNATPWLDLLKFVYSEYTEHIVKWFAHRRQRPGEKINHGLVFGGSPGIGKDTIIEPLKRAVGPWNFTEIAPKDLLGDFNPHVKSVVLRVSEARDSGEMSRYAMYEHSKTLLATPPDVLRCNEKNLREHDVFNVMGVIFTTNHRDGLYLPADDRRHCVVWSEKAQSDFREGYWREIYEWYEAEGFGHVAAYLDAVDLSGFDPKAPPPKTPAFWRMVDAGRAPEDGEMADALDKLGNPAAVTIGHISSVSSPSFQLWLREARNRRQIPHRFEAVGYQQVRNNAATDGMWKASGKRQVVYARKDLSERDRIAAASAVCHMAKPALPVSLPVGTDSGG